MPQPVDVTGFLPVRPAFVSGFNGARIDPIARGRKRDFAHLAIVGFWGCRDRICKMTAWRVVMPHKTIIG